MIAARRREFIEQKSQFPVTIRCQPLNIDSPAFLFGKCTASPFGFAQRRGIIAWAGKSMKTFLVQQEKGIWVSLGVRREASVMLAGEPNQFLIGEFDAVGVRLHENERVRADIDAHQGDEHRAG